MNSSILSCTWGALLVSATALSAPASVEPWAGRFLDEQERLSLIDTATLRWRVVRRILIEYEILPSTHSAQFAKAHRILALGAPGMVYHTGARFTSRQPWFSDPYRQELFVWAGKSCHRWPNTRMYSQSTIPPGETIGGLADALVAAIPIWPATDHRMDKGAAGMRAIIEEAVRSPNYRLLDSSEAVSGEACWIFDRDGIDQIWVARERPLCLMKREFRDRGSGRLLERIVTHKVREVSPGLWIPTALRNQFFARTDGTKEVIEVEGVINGVRVDLNENVPDSIFVPIQSPGSLEVKEAGVFTQVLPGGGDLRASTLDYMVHQLGLPTKPVPRNHPYLWLCVGLASGLCVGFFLFPMSKSHLLKAKAHDTSVSARCLNF